jgi:very-short-patch-repair endonuclease
VLVIFQDLRQLVDVAASNPIIGAFSRAGSFRGSSEALPGDLDSLPVPATVPVPVLPVDSSQLEALTQSAQGRHVVVHGPPGTGKSQTIANLIADALSRNQRVLFVSAKMAALNVVHDRLKELGLANFCLEAHSTKAGKATVIDELRRTLESESLGDGGRLDEELQALQKAKERLNVYVRTLHLKIGPMQLTPYRAMGRLAKLAQAADVRAALPWIDPLAVSKEAFQECVDCLEQLGTMAGMFDARHEHEWFGFCPPAFGVPQQEAIQDALNAVSNGCRTILFNAESLHTVIPQWQNLSLDGWEKLDRALEGLASLQHLPPGWWSADPNELDARAELFETPAAKRAEHGRLTAEHARTTSLSPAGLLDLLEPVDGKYSGWVTVLQPSFWKWRSQVKRSLSPGIDCGATSLRTLKARCSSILDIETWFGSPSSGLAEHAESPSEVLDQIATSLRCAAALLRALSNVGLRPEDADTAITPEMRSAAATLRACLPSADKVLSAALTLIDANWPTTFANKGPVRQIRVVELGTTCSGMAGDTNRMKEWARLYRILQKSHEVGLQQFIDALGTITAGQAPAAFERRFMLLWVSAAAQQHPVLHEFTETIHQDLIGKFRASDRMVRALAIAHAQAVASSASQRVREAQDHPQTGGEVSILRRELQKKKKIKPLRRLFAEIPHVLQALKPCLLMSPISVSTYLKPGAFEFDLAVFDEASQLPTAEAVPAVLRAKQVVVAGDSKQLPPTSFFETAVLDEEEEDEDQQTQAPLESMLDDCVAVVPVFEEAHLRWHYRSRDERLIRFSNHYFYDNKLVTFPAPSTSSDGQGVRFVYVNDGVWDRGRSRTNRQEARTVARLAIGHYNRHPDRSLGIVATNVSQKEAIEEAIEVELASRPDLATYFTDHQLVKALESVQGDEHETMIISVGYGRDANGGLSMNFGPINKDGGWRRLNVLVTRAKWECILVASIRATDLAGVSPHNRGAVSLRNFLEYAEQDGMLPADAPVETRFETNDFEEAVREALVERGYSVDMQVGAGKFRIDLAVRRKDDPNRYLLAIECDGATYHSSRTARDRDILRQEVLQRMGWRIHRVWSTEWFHDRDRALAALLRSLAQAEIEPEKQPVYAPPRVSEPMPPRAAPRRSAEQPAALSRRHPAGVEYKEYSNCADGGRELLMDSRNRWQLADLVRRVVATEGPIAGSLLTERLKCLCGVARAGSNVQSNVDCALQIACDSVFIEPMEEGAFYRCPKQELYTFRTPSVTVRRSIDQVSREEIALAVLHLVEDQFGVAGDRLPHSVLLLFGIERPRTEATARIEVVIRDLLQNGRLRNSGPQIHLA